MGKLKNVEVNPIQIKGRYARQLLTRKQKGYHIQYILFIYSALTVQNHFVNKRSYILRISNYLQCTNNFSTSVTIVVLEYYVH